MADALIAETEKAKASPEYARNKELLRDPEWRIDNLYTIIDKLGAEVRFKRNAAQRAYWKSRHSRDAIVKARQLGFSTAIEIGITDTCVFRKNTTAGIVDAKLDDAEVKLKKVSLAYHKLPQSIKDACPLTKENTKEMEWANGSRVSVGTTYRGGTPQILHVSEYGRTSVDKPDQAREIKKGSMEAVPSTGWCAVESTAHGTAGEFHDLIKRAEAKQKEGGKLTALDYRLHFYGWWLDRDYRLPNNLVVVPIELREYFAEIAPKLQQRHGIQLDANQMAWYTQKRFDLGPDDCFEEYPSIFEETFFKAILGAYWGREISKARQEKRIGQQVPYDPTRRVNTWWDIGEDCTAIIFSQTDGVRTRVIDYYEEEGGSLQSAAAVLDEKHRTREFIYGEHLGPHDLDNRDWANQAQSRYQTALSLGIKFRVVPRVAVKADSIEAGRRLLAMSWFDVEHCQLLVERLENYRKRWNKALQVFSPDPVHDMPSHGSDAWQQGAMGQSPDRGPDRDRGRPRPEPRRSSHWAA